MAATQASNVAGSFSRSMRRDEASHLASLNAPLFRSLVERMDEGGRWVVLDLGPAQKDIVALFNRFRCRLDIADLAEVLDELNAETETPPLSERAEAVLPAPRDESTDIVLCWDLMNYLRRPALTALMERIAARARPGTLVHAFIAYSAPRMPVRPDRYVPLDNLRLMNVATTDEQRDAPRYSPEDLALCMEGYEMERAVLLRNGMQEFLYRV